MPIAAIMILNLLAEGLGIEERTHHFGIDTIRREASTINLENLMLGRTDSVAIDCYDDGRIVPKPSVTRADRTISACIYLSDDNEWSGEPSNGHLDI